MLFRDRIKSLRRVRASDIAPHPKNWRRHPKAQRDALTAALGEIGWADVCLVREGEDGRLHMIDGHLRQNIGGDQKVPCLVLDVTEQEADKILATIDPIAGMAEADQAALTSLLSQLDLSDELACCLEGFAAFAELEIDAPPAPEPPEDPVTRAGDLWRLGDHRLLCDDAADAKALDRLLNGNQVDLLNCDPPYNVRVEPRSNNAIRAGLSSFPESPPGKHHQQFDLARHPEKSRPTTSRLRAKDRPLVNDYLPDEEYAERLVAWFSNAARVMTPGRSFYIWGGYANCANYPPALHACGMYFSQAIIWDKMHPVLGRKDFMGAHEWCFYGWREGAAHRFLGPKNVRDLWQVKKVTPQQMVHLTEKPVELAARAIQYSSRPRETVLDPFGGSGFTLMACNQLNRRSFTMELDPAYCDVIVNRWEAGTGGKADRAQ